MCLYKRQYSTWLQFLLQEAAFGAPTISSRSPQGAPWGLGPGFHPFVGYVDGHRALAQRWLRFRVYVTMRSRTLSVSWFDRKEAPLPLSVELMRGGVPARL